MIETTPPRTQGIILGSTLLLAGLSSAAVGALQLAVAGVTPQLVLWLVMVLVGMPLTLWSAYRLYNLATASYRLDRDRFALRWGGHEEQVPLSSLAAVEPVVLQEPTPWLASLLTPLLSPRQAADSTEIWYTTTTANLIRIELDERSLVISPSDPGAFMRAFVEATRQGSLQQVEPYARRPDLLPARLWTDQAARRLILAGLLLPLLYLALLALLAGRLPESVSFGFEPGGAPGPTVPSGRLLLLPLTGVVIWLADLLAGAWFYRQRTLRPMAYWVWGVGAGVSGALAVGGLLMAGWLP